MPWLKRGNTDTGTLDIGSLATGMTAGTWTLRRVGKWVSMNVYNGEFTPTQGTAWQSPAGMIPVGFRPVAVPPYVQFPGVARTVSMSAAGLRVSRYGGVDVYDIDGKRAAVTCMWVTDDAWPATYPGVRL